jgi:hypothetical protein
MAWWRLPKDVFLKRPNGPIGDFSKMFFKRGLMAY